MPYQNSTVYGSRVRTRNQGKTWVARGIYEGKDITLGCLSGGRRC